ncbi:MAG: Ig-like domain-containing protein, partial [candidate division WOR-3 bacterium]
MRCSVLLTSAILVLAGCTDHDVFPPSVRIVWPENGDTCRATTTVKVVAVDDAGVAAVELVVDGIRLATDSLGRDDTFDFHWDTRRHLPGSVHSLAASASDRSGNIATSSVVHVVIDPAAGTRHRGRIGEDETWRAQDSPHIVEGTLRVDARLRLEPGVVVLLLADASIVVGSGGSAAFQAVGAADSFIYFSSASTNPAPGDWCAIEFRPR